MSCMLTQVILTLSPPLHAGYFQPTSHLQQEHRKRRRDYNFKTIFQLRAYATCTMWHFKVVTYVTAARARCHIWGNYLTNLTVRFYVVSSRWIQTYLSKLTFSASSYLPGCVILLQNELKAWSTLFTWMSAINKRSRIWRTLS